MTARPFAPPLLAVLLVGGVLCDTPPRATAGPLTPLAKMLAKEIAERFGSRGARELAELGGREGLEEILERATREGAGDVAMKVARERGPAALKAAAPHPGTLLPALDRLPSGLTDEAVAALRRDPDGLAALVRAHGDNVLAAEARHPGFGLRLTRAAGVDGPRLLARCDEDAALGLVRRADEFAALPASSRHALADAVETGDTAGLRERLAELAAQPSTIISAGLAGALLIAAGETAEAADAFGDTLAGPLNELASPETVTERAPDGTETTTTRPGWAVPLRLVAGGLAAAFVLAGLGAAMLLGRRGRR